MTDSDLIITDGVELGECPLWSESESVLYWVDIDRRRVHRYDPAAGVDTWCELPGRPGSIALTDRPGVLLVAMEHDVVRLNYDPDLDGAAQPTRIGTVEHGPDRVRLNDGRAVGASRFAVGSMWEDTSERRYEGSLYLVDGTSVTTVESGVGVANGLAVDPMRQRLFFADSFAQKVWVYDFDPDLGLPTNRRLFLDYEPLPGAPDGACLDSEGGYWSASVNAGRVIRVDPDGLVSHVVEVPVDKPSMPAFGGPERDRLFVTAIATPDSPGGLLEVDTSGLGVTGWPEALVEGY